MKRRPCKAVVPSVLAFACIGVLFVASQLFRQDDLPQDFYRVYVNGEAVDYYAKRTESSPYVMLPFLALVASLEQPVVWKSDTVAEVTCCNRTWEFDIDSVCLTEQGSSSNLLCPPPGGIGGIWTETCDHDAYVDLRALCFFLTEYLDAKIVENDAQQRVIRITHAE